MQLLLIGAQEQANIAAIMAIAENNKVTLVEMRRRAESDANDDSVVRAANLLMHTVGLPRGYWATYTIEEQPIGWTKHLSVSVDRENKLPSREAVAMIMHAFKFQHRLEDSIWWIEPVDVTRGAINVIEPIAASPTGQS